MFAMMGKIKGLVLGGVAVAGLAVAAPAASAHERVAIGVSRGGFFAPPVAVVYQAPVVVAPVPACETPVVVAPAAVVTVVPTCVAVPVAPVYYHPDHVIYRGYDRVGWHR